MRDESTFFKRNITDIIKDNADKDIHARDKVETILANAGPWHDMDDETLWGLIFSPALERSWMVWSNGYCPGCREDVLMYNWIADPFMHPWKLKCPNCGELFPKNDFHAFYKSGINEDGVFHYEAADQSLLYNLEHPEPEHPLHKFGVDDGSGYVDEKSGSRWRFIGTYLVYGQWKNLIVGGITKLADAYLCSGEKSYAHKAGVLLARLAQLYPSYDFDEQGYVYEKPHAQFYNSDRSGYVSTWHDACREHRYIVLSYDKVYEAVKCDSSLAEFVSKKAQRRISCEDICETIDKNILIDSLNNQHKIYSNFPERDITVLIIKTIIGWEKNKRGIEKNIINMLDEATAKDGVTGEKGMAAYAASTISFLADFLALYDYMDDGFLKRMLESCPGLYNTYRFFIDTWCMDKYYPNIGDSKGFAEPQEHYLGVFLEESRRRFYDKGICAEPDVFRFLYKLYTITKDVDYIRVLYREKMMSPAKTLTDITMPSSCKLDEIVDAIIEQKGALIDKKSVNKENWHLALMRSGRNGHERVLWMDYDNAGRHGHNDMLNIGFYAYGMDIMPDFGYPPVNSGGWNSKEVAWYKSAFAHNTIVMDRKASPDISVHETGGKTCLWSIGRQIKALSVSAPGSPRQKRLERLVALIDISGEDSYFLDIIRAQGGREHLRFIKSSVSCMSTKGLNTASDENDEFRELEMITDVKHDGSPGKNWSARWAIEDIHKCSGTNAGVGLEFTDLTYGGDVYTAASWVNLGGYKKKEGRWLPTVITQRKSVEEGLSSTFAGIYEPYKGCPKIKEVKRLEIKRKAMGKTFQPECDVAVQITLPEGRKDLLVSKDTRYHNANGDGTLYLNEYDLEFSGELCLIRYDQNKIYSVSVCKAKYLKIGNLEFNFDKEESIYEYSSRA